LIEIGAKLLGENDPEPSMEGASIGRFRPHRPILKIHGSVTEKDYTLWFKRQLRSPKLLDEGDRELRRRVFSLSKWLKANLVERDLVLVGFWSDWDYLNAILRESLRAVHGSLVVLVTPQPAEELKKKAPALWRWATTKSKTFHHVPESGDTFLEELRIAFSQKVLKQVLVACSTGAQPPAGGIAPPSVEFGDLTKEVSSGYSAGVLAGARASFGPARWEVSALRVKADPL
jgi:hypothetical protein